jgi:hypothetical protein
VADDLTHEHAAQPVEPLAAPVAAPVQRAPLAQRAAVHGARFALAYALLAVVLGASLGLAVVLAGRDPGTGAAWTEWRPASRGVTTRAKEIADHVSRRYRLASGRQIVGVIAGELAVQNVPVDVIAVRGGPTRDDVDVVDARGSVMFVLCGLGEKCSIDEGTASTDRHRLLRREALELALYAFKYTDAKKVVAFMPPRAGQDATAALYFREQDLERQLDEPLRRTLAPASGLMPATFPAEEVAVVDALTEPRLFNFAFQQAQSGNALMVLEPAL